MHKICSQPDHLTFPVLTDFRFFGLISGRRSAYPVIRVYVLTFQGVFILIISLGLEVKESLIFRSLRIITVKASS